MIYRIGFRSETGQLWPGPAEAIVQPVVQYTPLLARDPAPGDHTILVNRHCSQYQPDLLFMADMNDCERVQLKQDQRSFGMIWAPGSE
jgi:hypothetical protein